MPFREKIANFIGYGLFAFFLCISLYALYAHSVMGGVCFILVSIVSLPKTRRITNCGLARKGYAVDLIFCAKLLTVAGVLFTALSEVSVERNRLAERTIAENIQKVEQEKIKQLALNDEFTRDKDTILAEAQKLIFDGKYARAKELLFKYSLTDIDLISLKTAAEAAEVKDSLAVYKIQDSKRLELLRRLVQLEPKNSYAKEQAENLLKDLQHKEVLQAAMSARQSQIDSWVADAEDQIIDAIKAGMHNPDSFKYVSTKVVNLKNGINVFVFYRGTNVFGGVVTNRMCGSLDKNGNLYKIATVDC